MVGVGFGTFDPSAFAAASLSTGGPCGLGRSVSCVPAVSWTELTGRVDSSLPEVGRLKAMGGSFKIVLANSESGGSAVFGEVASFPEGAAERGRKGESLPKFELTVRAGVVPGAELPASPAGRFESSETSTV